MIAYKQPPGAFAPVTYTLIRSKRKTLALQISRELEVVARAPNRMAKRDIDAFVEEHRSWIEKHIAKLSAYNEAYPEPSEQELAAMAARAKAEIPPRVAVYAEKMGLTPSGVKITSAKTRFGSCNGRNGICFSCRLMGFPQEAVDYVVVHELAHIAHKNHGKDFYRLVESVLPDYQARRAMLKKGRK